jgi:hypothetical protein
MGATTSVQVPNETYQKYREIIQQAIVPSDIVTKGDASFRSLDLYRFTNDASHKTSLLRPIRQPKQSYYATRPTFLGRNGPTHLIGTISEKSLKRIPTNLTSDEALKINVAYKLLLHTLNACAIILGSETPGTEDITKDQMLLQTLKRLYKSETSTSFKGVKLSTETGSSYKQTMDIIGNATATLANVEDTIQSLRKENAFLTFSDNVKVVQDIARYITPRKESSTDTTKSTNVNQLSIFREVLNSVNTLTVCGAKPNTFLGRLSKSGE